MLRSSGTSWPRNWASRLSRISLCQTRIVWTMRVKRRRDWSRVGAQSTLRSGVGRSAHTDCICIAAEFKDCFRDFMSSLTGPPIRELKDLIEANAATEISSSKLRSIEVYDGQKGLRR